MLVGIGTPGGDIEDEVAIDASPVVASRRIGELTPLPTALRGRVPSEHRSTNLQRRHRRPLVVTHRGHRVGTVIRWSGRWSSGDRPRQTGLVWSGSRLRGGSSGSGSSTHTSVVDVDGYICPHVGACGSSLNGQELRPDGLQYADPGGGLLATWIVRELTQPRRWVIMAAAARGFTASTD